MNCEQRISVLDYKDFGPQVIASEVIGAEWWQWQSHGDSRPAQYDIKVIVYRDIAFDEVQECYPVDQKNKKDYRYLEYNKALSYLNSKIDDNVIKRVTDTLKDTRKKIDDDLGE